MYKHDMSEIKGESFDPNIFRLEFFFQIPNHGDY